MRGQKDPKKQQQLALARLANMSGRLRSPRRVRMVACTHINMDRCYGWDQTCHNCGRPPHLGFLYVCAQDDRPKPSTGLHSSGDDYDGSMIEGAGAISRRVLEEIGLSESVIRTAEEGGYTPAQLELLKSQKLHLKQAIQDLEDRNLSLGLAHSLSNGPSNNDGTVASAPEAPGSQSCHYKACPTCRPYYVDRVWGSFDAVFSGETPPLTSSDAALLPKKDARILRRIGLRPNPPSLTDQSLFTSETPSTIPTSTASNVSVDQTDAHSHSSTATFKTTKSDLADVQALRSRGHRFYTLANRSSGLIARTLTRDNVLSRGRQTLRSTIQNIFGKRSHPSYGSSMASDDSEISASSHAVDSASEANSTITLPYPRSGTARDLQSGEKVKELDIGALRRVRRQRERVDLRNGEAVSGFELGPRRRATFGSDALGHICEDAMGPHAQSSHTQDEDNASEASEGTVYSCLSEGSEVEVTGGVALTEEAVETHIPDILSLEVKPVVKCDNDDDEEDEDEGGIDLGSIMTQR